MIITCAKCGAELERGISNYGVLDDGTHMHVPYCPMFLSGTNLGENPPLSDPDLSFSELLQRVIERGHVAHFEYSNIVGVPSSWVSIRHRNGLWEYGATGSTPEGALRAAQRKFREDEAAERVKKG